MDPHTKINTLSICSGIAGLDLGVELATGGAARPVCFVEREAFASAILAKRMEEKAVAAAPIWSDLRSFDGKPWRGVVDLIVGGYPCQPFSTAGKRAGADDPRHLWPEIARIIEETQCSIVFFENVSGHLSLGLTEVLRDLERMGFRYSAGLFTAAEVGASHRRERVFILGIRNNIGVGNPENDNWRSGKPTAQAGIGEEEKRWRRSAGADASVAHPTFITSGEGKSCHISKTECGSVTELFSGSSVTGGKMADTSVEFMQKSRSQSQESWELGFAECGSGKVANASGNGLQGRGAEEGQPVRGCGNELADTMPNRSLWIGETWPTEGATERSSGDEVADTDGARFAGCGIAECEHQDSGNRSEELEVFPPGPGDFDAWRGILEQHKELSPSIEREFRGVVDGAAARVDRLRALGNGVVPLVAAYAFLSLYACIRRES